MNKVVSNQKMKISIGIDIGSDGAYAIFVNNKLQYGKIPYISEEPDMNGLFDIIYKCIPSPEWQGGEVDFTIHCVIEDLHSVFGSSAKSNFEFGKNNGLIIGMLQVAEIPYTKIGPKKWQKELWQGIRPVEIPVIKSKVHQVDKKGNLKYKVDTKATSLIAAQRLFPKETFLATERSKVPHDGIVDAVLIAEYCKRHF